jgi:hypothetical protein
VLFSPFRRLTPNWVKDSNSPFFNLKRECYFKITFPFLEKIWIKIIRSNCIQKEYSKVCYLLQKTSVNFGVYIKSDPDLRDKELIARQSRNQKLGVI